MKIAHQILYGKNNYHITRDGKVFNIKTNREIKPNIRKDGK